VPVEQWEILDHICRVCFGRLLRRRASDNKTIVRCADCDAEAIGHVEALCVCGAKLVRGRLSGLRCRINPQPTPEQPSRVVAGYVGEKSCPG
jgi:hypothetical protein